MDPQLKSVPQLKVAIVGAGPSGLAQLRAFQSAKAKGLEVPQVVCFEKQAEWGGLWNFTWRTGADNHGDPVHGSMYRYLWSNGPKEALEFADYTFEEHFGKQISSYPPREVLWDYIKGRVEKADVKGLVRFNTAIIGVEFDKETEQFTVHVRDYDKDETYSELFDHVIVASGHFSVPNVPEFPGFNKFHGRIMHSHDFRDAGQFTGKNILLIGSSYSAEDIGSQCYKYGAKRIYSSYRSAPMGFKWPENWTEHQLTHVDGNNAYFQDGSSGQIDAIILCTGYLHHFPFMAEDLRLKTHNCLYPLGLYEGVAWQKNPKLFYVGMQDQWYSFNMFDAQAWYVRDVILRKIQLPQTEEVMLEHSQMYNEEEKRECLGFETCVKFQGEYIKRLINQTDYPTFDVDAVNAIFGEWMQHKRDNIMTFRNQVYRSVMTGNMAKPHHTKWLDALDDSFETYFSGKPVLDTPVSDAPVSDTPLRAEHA